MFEEMENDFKLEATLNERAAIYHQIIKYIFKKFENTSLDADTSTL